MKTIKEAIDQQLACNSHINLYHVGAVDAFVSIDKLWNESFTEFTNEEKEILINYVSDQTLKYLFGINQYYHFNNPAIGDLKNIYRNIFNLKERNEIVYFKSHAYNIQVWLKKYQPAYQSYFDKQTTLLTNFVPCFGYSAELQMDLLDLNIRQVQQPVLDIGCGEKANLVQYLKKQNIDAFGIDRLCENNEIIQSTDWLKYDYIPDKWGTIISHLGFSNHFRHQHLQQNGDVETYARKYMEMLRSLKVGGSFFYTPGLEFIEKYLASDTYNVVSKNSGISEFSTVRIIRIK